MITRLVKHHTGGLQDNTYASAQHLTAKDIDLAHKERFKMKSSLGRWGGYNFFIERDGKLTQFRKIGEETAAQKGYNSDSISVCLAGNFTINPSTKMPVDRPTLEQITRMKALDIDIIEKNFENDKYAVVPGTKIDIKLKDIIPHRALGNTDCYGDALNNNWGRSYAAEYLNEKIGLLSMIIELLARILDLKTRLNQQLFGKVVPTPCWLDGEMC